MVLPYKQAQAYHDGQFGHACLIHNIKQDMLQVTRRQRRQYGSERA